MRIEFGKIINDQATKEKCLYWYTENHKTLLNTLKNSGMSIELLFDNEIERIYLLNKESFIYIGIISKYYTNEEYEVSSNRGYGAIAGYINHNDSIDVSEVLICELNYNSFKGIHKSVFENVSRESGISKPWIGYPDIVRNYPYISKYGRFTYKECLSHCAPLIQKYDLNKIIDSFDGVPMCVAVYRIEDSDGTFGYATYCFEDIEKAHEYARKCVKNHLVYCLDFIEVQYKYGRPNARPSELIVSDRFKTIFKKRLTINGTQVIDTKDVFKYISYYLVEVNDNPHPNIEEIELEYSISGQVLPPNYGKEYLSEQVFAECEKGAFDNCDYLACADEKVKWKSEFLVYQIVKKLYPIETVYQYRPLFLKSDKGQMSYDVFIFGMNIAIEYQGKQHFEPIEYFGGEESFENNQKRDKLKKELSDKNGVKLIYIRYDETINESLIEQRIKAVLENNDH